MCSGPLPFVSARKPKKTATTATTTRTITRLRRCLGTATPDRRDGGRNNLLAGPEALFGPRSYSTGRCRSAVPPSGHGSAPSPALNRFRPRVLGDVGQVAVALADVEAVPHHELRRDRESDVLE